MGPPDAIPVQTGPARLARQRIEALLRKGVQEGVRGVNYRPGLDFSGEMSSLNALIAVQECSPTSAWLLQFNVCAENEWPVSCLVVLKLK